ncbi:MAG: TonB-dependent receptor [Chitinophagaceae bacterium]
MKLTTALLLLTCFQVSAHVYSQNRITLNLQSTELKKALAIIEHKTSYRFLYNDETIKAGTKVEIDASNAPVTEVLDKLFANKSLHYKILENNLVVITNKETDVQETKVSGKITASTGETLAGVSVKVKGSTLGTQTDVNGNFSLTVPDNAVLVISYVGYTTQEVSVDGRSSISINLVASTKVLDQVVVVGYGSQRKIDVTGSVTNIKGEEISKQASQNVLSGLQGKVAGVQITNSGAPGASPDIRIRGLGTYYGGVTPLYVVDGVWMSDVSFLAPNDIESINILKDASSEAIYGIRGANGVVIITTKKGKSNKPVISYNGTVGYQKITNQVKMANANEYATMFNELARFSNSTTFLDSSKFGTGTNWFNQVLRNALVTNHQIGISGGGEKSTYNFSLSYLNQDGILKTNNYQRYTATLQNDIQLSKAIKVGYTAIGAFSKSNDAPGGIWGQVYNAPPVIPVKFADGVTYGDPGYYGLGSSVANPQVTLDYNNAKSKNYRLTGNAYIDIKFLQHFTYHGFIGGEYGDAQTKNYTPVYKATSTQQNAQSNLAVTRGETQNWIAENTITYQNTFGDHKITALVGQHAERNSYNYLSLSAKNVPNINSGSWYLGLGTNQNAQDVDLSNPTNPAYPLLSTISSYFGRVNYSFMDRYLLTATIRADGSSKFFGADRTGYFPSVGAAWVISKEKFMQNQDIFNSLKLKASWGKVGNVAVPTYVATQSTVSGGAYSVIYNNSGVVSQGVSVASVAPPQIHWEKGVGTDIGIEAAVLNNKLNVEVDYYNRKTQDMIFPIIIGGAIGTSSSSVLGNVGTLQNRGVEFAVNWNDVVSKDFNYTLSANFSINNNKLTANTTGNQTLYDGGKGSTGGQYTTLTTVGQPIGAFYGYQVIGIFQSASDVTAYADKNGTVYQPNAKPGDFKYAKTSNGGLGAIGSTDRVILGNPNPKYTYGFNTYFGYKQFDLALDFQGVAGVQVYNANKGLRYGAENFTQDYYDHRWHGAGTSNSYPSVNIGGGDNFKPNSWYVENGSYFRIRNVQLGYTCKLSSGMKNIGIQKLRVFANTQNPFTFFKYKGFSPEVGGGPGNTGIDTQIYPLSATYNLGVNLSF